MSEAVIIVKERSAGNEQVGDMWLETKLFLRDETLGDVLKWQEEQGNPSGRLMITVPHEDDKQLTDEIF